MSSGPQPVRVELCGELVKVARCAHLILVNISFPANVKMFNSLMAKVMNLDMALLMQFNSIMLDLKESAQSFNSNFKQLGYDSLNLVDNMGSLFTTFMLLVGGTFLALVPVERRFTGVIGTRWVKFRRIMLFSPLIRLFLEA